MLWPCIFSYFIWIVTEIQYQFHKYNFILCVCTPPPHANTHKAQFLIWKPYTSWYILQQFMDLRGHLFGVIQTCVYLLCGYRDMQNIPNRLRHGLHMNGLMSVKNNQPFVYIFHISMLVPRSIVFIRLWNTTGNSWFTSQINVIIIIIIIIIVVVLVVAQLWYAEILILYNS